MTPTEPLLWTPALVTAILGGLVALVGSFTAMFVVLYGLLRESKQTVSKILVKADEIHELTNSRLSAVMDDLKAANVKIEGLEKTITILYKELH